MSPAVGWFVSVVVLQKFICDAFWPEDLPKPLTGRDPDHLRELDALILVNEFQYNVHCDI